MAQVRSGLPARDAAKPGTPAAGIVLVTIAALILLSSVYLGTSQNPYSFADGWHYATHLRDYALSSGGYETRILGIFITIIVIYPIALFLFIVFLVTGIRSLARHRREIKAGPIRRRSTGEIVVPAPVGSREHANFNPNEPIPAPLVSPPVTRADEAWSAPSYEEGVSTLVLPEGMSIPAGLSIPPNIRVRETNALGAMVSQSTTIPAPPTLQTSPPSPAPPTPPVRPDAAPANVEVAPGTDNRGATPSSAPRRSNHIALPTDRKMPRSRFIFMSIFGISLAVIVSGIGYLATNHITRADDLAHPTSSGSWISPSLARDISHGSINPEIASMWLMVAIALVLTLQLWALVSISTVMKRRVIAG